MGGMAELAIAIVLKTIVRKGVRVRVLAPPHVQMPERLMDWSAKPVSQV